MDTPWPFILSSFHCSREKVDAFWDHSNLNRDDVIGYNTKAQPVTNGIADSVLRCKWCREVMGGAGGRGSHEKTCPERRKIARGDTKTVRMAARVKRADRVCALDTVSMNGSQLKNVFDFKYLGVWFQSDGDMSHAIEVRLAQARSRFNRLNHLWKSCFLSKRTKLRLY